MRRRLLSRLPRSAWSDLLLGRRRRDQYGRPRTNWRPSNVKGSNVRMWNCARRFPSRTRDLPGSDGSRRCGHSHTDRSHCRLFDDELRPRVVEIWPAVIDFRARWDSSPKDADRAATVQCVPVSHDLLEVECLVRSRRGRWDQRQRRRGQTDDGPKSEPCADRTRGHGTPPPAQMRPNGRAGPPLAQRRVVATVTGRSAVEPRVPCRPAVSRLCSHPRPIDSERTAGSIRRAATTPRTAAERFRPFRIPERTTGPVVRRRGAP